jgi:flagellar M-ring protein FliF
VTLESIKARLATLAGSFTPGQLASMAGAFLLVSGLIVGSAWWLNAPTYRVLFSDMDPESASQVVSRLRDRKISYELTDGGRTVRVPETQIDQLRLDFSGQGMLPSGRIGFEIFDRTQFGATEFLEQVNYRRALEGEIARTIATIAEVASARVHIAMAKNSLFGNREHPAKASVVLKLRHPQRPLSASTVQGISSLVAASVEGLRPESVVVVDSDGRPLSRPTDEEGEPLGAAQVERQQRYEREVATRVVSLLEPAVGAGRVRVNVAARLHHDSEDRLEESWDPSPVVRSRTSTEEGGSGGGLSHGLAGARANLPGPALPGRDEPSTETMAPPTPAQARSGSLRSAETVNYEVGKVIRHTVRPRGDLARLSVAVIVDDAHAATRDGEGNVVKTSKPRDLAEIQKIHALVAAAVGLDPARGDQLTVENIAFDEPLPEESVPTPGALERYGPAAREVGKGVVVLVLGLLVFVFVVRPLLRGARTAPSVSVQPLPQQQLPRTVEELEGEIEAQLDALALSRGSDRRMPVLSKRVAGIAAKEPASAARLVRTWLVEKRPKP